TVGVAVVGGGGGGPGGVVVLFGGRAGLRGTGAVVFLLLELPLIVGGLVPASLYFVRLARPRRGRRNPTAVVGGPFVAIILLAAISLAFAPITYWDDMIVGDRWLECLLSIPVIAIVPFAAIIWARRLTRPGRAHSAASWLAL